MPPPDCATLTCFDDDMDPANDCYACSQTTGACQTEGQNCDANPDCAALRSCLVSGQLPAQECADLYSAGIDDYNLMADCVLGAGGECEATCTPPSCNPITGAGCDVAGGEACDLTGQGGYACFPPPNNVGICQTCDFSGNYCVSGLTCVPTNSAGTTLQCARFCCTDADCGAGGLCDVLFIGDGVGVCAVDHSTYVTPKCTGLPAVAPSMGSCAP